MKTSVEYKAELTALTCPSCFFPMSDPRAWLDEAYRRCDSEPMFDRTDLPRALSALRAVLDLHKPYNYEGDSEICEDCYEAFPCSTIRALEEALNPATLETKP